MIRKTGLVWLLLLFCTAVRASNLRQISSREGISNNAILSLAQDKHGFIWVGSCDGLNMWDGERMRLFPNDWGGETPLSGNLIEEIHKKFPEKTIWLYTGFLWEDIKDLPFLKYVDVLVDGPFVEAEKDVTLHWKGSANQRVIDVKKSLAQGSVVLYESK